MEELWKVKKRLKVTSMMFLKAGEGAGVDSELRGEVVLLVESVEQMGELFEIDG